MITEDCDAGIANRYAPKCYFRTDYDNLYSYCWNQNGRDETPWGNTLVLCGREDEDDGPNVAGPNVAGEGMDPAEVQTNATTQQPLDQNGWHATGADQRNRWRATNDPNLGLEPPLGSLPEVADETHTFHVSSQAICLCL